MAGQQRHIRAATTRLADELERQILPDGGHISRNPGALIELLVDLLPLRTAFTARNIAPPPALLNAIDRMMPMLRFFRHGDGSFALFNGMGPTRTDLLTTILAYDDARGSPLANAPHSGYQRFESAGIAVVMDTGRAPPMPVSQEAHAGCLSFELSIRQYRLVVNCGLPATSRDSWRQVARATAAHSTATLNDTSSCRFIESAPIRRMLDGTPMVGGPRQVDVAREQQDDGIVLRTSHNGYADIFNVIHHRTLLLAPDGHRLDGEDEFTPAKGETCRQAATSSRSASTCIPRSRPTACPTATASCCCCRTRRAGSSTPMRIASTSRKASTSPGRTGRAARSRSSSTDAPAM